MAYTHQNIKIVEGNTFALVLPLVSRTYTLNGIPVDEDIDYTQLENVKVTIGTMEYAYTIEEAGVQVVDNGTLKQGTYNVVLTATYQGSLLRAAWFELVTIVAWNMQSDADQYLQGSPIVCEAAVVLAGTLTDAELEALKAEYRLKNAQLDQAIEDAEAAKEHYDELAEQLQGVAQEVTSQQILYAISHIDFTQLAKQGSNPDATNTAILAAFGNIDFSQLAKQGDNPNANISDILEEVTPEFATDEEIDNFLDNILTDYE